MTIFLFFAGLILLIAGAELLVRGASEIALFAGLSKLVIGLTVVAYGTSFPELVVSSVASYVGEPDIAVGNVVGSNIFNILCVIGISAAIIPLYISRQIIRLDVPVMIAVAIIMFLFSLDGVISRFEGAFLTTMGFIYTWWIISSGKKESSEENSKDKDSEVSKEKRWKKLIFNIFLVLAGLTLLAFGSRWLVDGAVYIARALEVSELVIALVIVAAGTSLPELATSVVAAIKHERDIAVGNIIGSNIFNIVFVLGLSGLIASQPIRVSPAALKFDIPVMLAVSVACIPVFFTGKRIARWEGIVFIGYYIFYTVYLILTAREHYAVPLLNEIMLSFIVPLTVLTILLTLLHSIRKKEKVKK